MATFTFPPLPAPNFEGFGVLPDAVAQPVDGGFFGGLNIPTSPVGIFEEAFKGAAQSYLDRIQGEIGSLQKDFNENVSDPVSSWLGRGALIILGIILIALGVWIIGRQGTVTTLVKKIAG